MRRLLPCALLLIYGGARADSSLPGAPKPPAALTTSAWASRCVERLRHARDQALQLAPQIFRGDLEIGRVPIGREQWAPGVELRIGWERPALTAYVWLGADPQSGLSEDWIKPDPTSVKPIVPWVRRRGRAYASIDAATEFPDDLLNRMLDVIRPAVDDCLFWGRDAAR